MESLAYSAAAIRALLGARDDLRQALGDEWSSFSRYAASLLASLLDEDADEIGRRMDEFLRMGGHSPAASIFEGIRAEASRVAETAGGATVAPLLLGDVKALAQEALDTYLPAGSKPEPLPTAAARPRSSAPPPQAPPLPPPSPAAPAPSMSQPPDVQDGFVEPVPKMQESGSAPDEASGDTGGEPEAESKPLRVNAWIGDGPDALTEALPVGEEATLWFQVGAPHEASLISGPGADIERAAIPEFGLDTEWVVTSTAVALASVEPGTTVSHGALDGPGGSATWTAVFSLHIGRDGSEARRLLITPQGAGEPTLDVMIYVGRELYRQLIVRLRVGDAFAPAPAAGETVRLEADVAHSPESETSLRTTHEWTTPPEELSIAVMGDRAFVHGSAGGEAVACPVAWYGVPASVAGPIGNVRKAAENFRAVHEAYLNAIEPAFLEHALDPRNFAPVYDWTIPPQADPEHMQAWDAVSRSPELYELASYGYLLYQAFFPDGSDLRAQLGDLWPAARLDIFATRDTNPAWLPDVPWGLMYQEPPAYGQPVDPLRFLGLRFRISYTIHAVADASKALGALDSTYRAHLLYWGGQPQDPTALEARRQAAAWGRWPNQVFVPASPDSPGAKAELVKLLSDPEQSPTSVLYLFCQCSVGDGDTPILRFGSTNKPDDVVRQLELGFQPLADRPLVFANACSTAAADPYMANELAETFFRRQCRAFIGTETKVPIEFAGRFASIFFSFFYREADPAPMAAGEAVCQARLFLWNRLASIGGLFYTYLNQYELFLADKDEVAGLRG